ncbi:MAG: isoleucine--tRNA ligase [Bacteroidales bacterium]|nr:isoleucine--tRNA ligase [Bacteroidales bacterium]MBQ6100666.1 isoleucine--tRNA ligase [Bacteroidales bacterium]
MKNSYKEYKQLNLTETANEIRKYWEENDTFQKSLDNRDKDNSFVFFEGPPSANGTPGIHHVMARSIKDVVCRYQTLKGKHVVRKAGWDTHGLPVELGVEKKLGITKEDIGKKISVDDYNRACREEVMKYKDMWDDLTRKMGYWVNLNDPYITFTNDYIETLWFLLKDLYNKGLLYKGYTIQPYSPAAGTGLSSHELNMPGCYRDVKDLTCVALFKLKVENDLPTYAIAWTTTPWTLPSNTALCVGPNIDYVLLKAAHPYTEEPCYILMAKALVATMFKEAPEVVKEYKGKDLVGISYEPLIPWVDPGEGAFRIIPGDYVTIEDGTGIVHIAPTFGADDKRVAAAAGIPPLQMIDKDGKPQPMVDRTGKFWLIEDLDPEFVKNCMDVEAYRPYAGQFVKNAYDPTKTEKDKSLDVDIVMLLKEQGKLFKSEKHTHNYPHCWRTDKPVLYYPLDSWFIKTTVLKDRMIELNKTINWKPEATGSGRFGNWLENLVDWNLSRSRYWGTPLPIWRTEDGKEEICIGSVEELRNEIEKSIKAGFMTNNPYASEDYTKFDLHRPYIDGVVLVSNSGKKMFREPDLIDVWFDSGAMPYAQYHCMAKKDEGGKLSPLNSQLSPIPFPADFIAEGVDQTRGWFFTLHAIATMCFDSVAYKNVISNGLVLDKNGNKMSKRLGNAVDPFGVIEKYGADAVRWYMITNSQPWDNLKFDEAGVDEVRRKFFGTLYNTYAFFALYANIDKFDYTEADMPYAERPEIDRWILSELNSLILEVDNAYQSYEPTRAGRAIADFVDAHLSNWYVRLSRRRFWRSDDNKDKLSAYQTLYTCLETVARLSSPIAPFFSEQLYRDLNNATGRNKAESVHLTDFPVADTKLIDKALEERMEAAQLISSLVLSLRKKANIRVRQPLSKIMIPVANDEMKSQLEKISHLIMSEVNIKGIEFLAPDNNILVKNVKPNFKTLGRKYGKQMKQIQTYFANMTQDEIHAYEKNNGTHLDVDGVEVELTLEDALISTQDIPGWAVTSEGNFTVALDMTITEELFNEGLAREIVNRVQTLRKNSGFEVTDRIVISIEKNEQIETAVERFNSYICSETLANYIQIVDKLEGDDVLEDELTDKVIVRMKITKP